MNTLTSQPSSTLNEGIGSANSPSQATTTTNDAATLEEIRTALVHGTISVPIATVRGQPIPPAPLSSVSRSRNKRSRVDTSNPSALNRHVAGASFDITFITEGMSNFDKFHEFKNKLSALSDRLNQALHEPENETYALTSEMAYFVVQVVALLERPQLHKVKLFWTSVPSSKKTGSVPLTTEEKFKIKLSLFNNKTTVNAMIRKKMIHQLAVELLSVIAM